MTIPRVILILLDSIGADVAAPPIPAAYRDEAADAQPRRARGLRLPNLERLGLGNVASIEGVARVGASQAAFGRLTQRSAGKDLTTGYWELFGLETRRPFATFPEGFPPELIEAFERETGRGVLGNLPAPGGVIPGELCEEHLKSGEWIVATSEDSVFQVAAHRDVVPVDELYEACRTARRIVDPYRVCRVIASPFKGRRGRFVRLDRRRDFAMPPPRPTVLDKLGYQGVPVVGIGRVDDIFAGRGLSETVHTQGNTDGMIKLIEVMTRLDRGLIVIHLDDFDSRFGTRRNARGFARCLEEFDVQLAMLLSRSLEDDLLLLAVDTCSELAGGDGASAAHPRSSSHREALPILAAGPSSTAGIDLGTRKSLADVGATLAEIFAVEPPEAGESFLKEIS